MRLIDADLPMEQMEKLLDHHLMMGNFYADGAVSDCIEFLKTAPTVDAVEVVRCKECKYSTPDIMSEDYRACWERNTVMPNDGFCSYGKRKEASE